MIYNVENIFKNRKIETKKQKNQELIEYKESYVKKILKKIKALFGK